MDESVTIVSEFQVNDFITLKLKHIESEDEYDDNWETVIYIKGERFNQCSFLLINIPIGGIKSFDEIKSIDEAAERLGVAAEGPDGRYKYNVTHEVEFWGHCSNLQVWVEYNYDTRLLRMDLAFPLLRRLTEIGDTVAKKVFKEEIVKRFLSGHPSVMKYLFEELYLGYLDEGEYDFLFKEFKARGIEGDFVTYENHIVGFITDSVYGKSLYLSSSSEVFTEHEILFDIRINDITKIQGLNKLTDLAVLNISGHEITEIKGLDNLTNLKELSLSSNQISEIKGLEHLTNLKKLYLSANQISEIKGLDKLINLENLWLSKNKITEIKGLENLKNLKVILLDFNPVLKIKSFNLGTNGQEYVKFCRNKKKEDYK